MKLANVKHQAACLVAIAITCTGCGAPADSGDANVQGAVTIDGELATRGSVTFHPVDGGPTAYSEIMTDGSYSLRVGQGARGSLNSSKIDSGEYVATVVVTLPSSKDKPIGESGPPTPGARITAAKYSKKDTSDLFFSVESGRNVFPIDLEAASPEEALSEQEADTSEGNDAASNEDSTLSQKRGPSAEVESAEEEPE